MVWEIRPRDLAVRLANGHPVNLLDVRQPWQHQQVALPEGRLIPLNELPGRVREVPGGNDVLVAYCHHGVRNRSAAGFLERLGWRNVASLASGVDAWAREVDRTLRHY